jgi:hypothetical protein
LISAGMKFGKKSSSMLYQNIRAHFEAWKQTVLALLINRSFL